MLILYAEDDIDDFNLFCEVIHSFDPRIECVNAVNGIAALEFLENSKALPDYVVVDINMPAMDGKACLKNIKKDPKFAYTRDYIFYKPRSERYRALQGIGRYRLSQETKYRRASHSGPFQTLQTDLQN
ncbi:response regulator [Ohtaekwangia koreensis]|uniref:Response regulator receiver domain-containing protein n=1 Tax=Ohtaekwangia koreensis TaxID=688867 RepID=A0A1T5M4Y7_9BACT|nr:response regulator [Ohtaekwangia koreensis]SKC83292.1 Response regulator receiver domain-containing protein [Ohtaekwangia koreensis]